MEGTKRVFARWKIGPNAVDYNGLMFRLEHEKAVVALLVPRYFLWWLVGFYAYVSHKRPKT